MQHPVAVRYRLVFWLLSTPVFTMYLLTVCCSLLPQSRSRTKQSSTTCRKRLWSSWYLRRQLHTHESWILFFMHLNQVNLNIDYLQYYGGWCNGMMNIIACACALHLVCITNCFFLFFVVQPCWPGSAAIVISHYSSKIVSRPIQQISTKQPVSRNQQSFSLLWCQSCNFCIIIN
jgi:hypothetical protein